MFYKGQPVRCLESCPGQFTFGKTYIVAAHPGSDPDRTYVEADDCGEANGWRSYLFEPIITPITELAVGDRVMIVSCGYAPDVAGHTGVILHHSGRRHFIIRFDDSFHYNHWHMCNDTVVKLSGEPVVTKETITLGVKPSIADDLRLSPQTRKVLHHLRSGNSLTHLEAQAVYGIWSLSSRVSELKNVGYKVRSVLKNDAMGKRYARYSMAV